MEDLTRLWITFEGITEIVKTAGVTVRLEWKPIDGDTTWPADVGNPAIKIYKAVEVNGGRKYLQEDTWAGQQLTPPYDNALGQVGRGSPLTLPLSEDTLTNLTAANSKIYFLFEGTSEGKGRLALTLIKGGQKIGEYPPLYLELKDVRRMYERAKAQPEGIQPPFATMDAPFAGPVEYVADPWNWQFERPHDRKRGRENILADSGMG